MCCRTVCIFTIMRRNSWRSCDILIQCHKTWDMIIKFNHVTELNEGVIGCNCMMQSCNGPGDWKHNPELHEWIAQRKLIIYSAGINYGIKP